MQQLFQLIGYNVNGTKLSHKNILFMFFLLTFAVWLMP